MQEEVLIQAPSTSSVARVDDLGAVCSTLISPFSTSFTWFEQRRENASIANGRVSRGVYKKAKVLRGEERGGGGGYGVCTTPSGVQRLIPKQQCMQVQDAVDSDSLVVSCTYKNERFDQG